MVSSTTALSLPAERSDPGRDCFAPLAMTMEVGSVGGGLLRYGRRHCRMWRRIFRDRTGHRNEEHAHVALRMDLALVVLGIDVQHLAALERLADRDHQPP